MLCRFSFAAPFRKGWGMCLDFPHRIAVVDTLATLWTRVILKIWDHVGLAFDFPGPVSPHFLEGMAAARWANGKRFHYSSCPTRGLVWKR